LGFFDKIVNCDSFVLLDHVQFQKTGGNWTNRVKIYQNGEGVWCTAPVARPEHGVARICDLSWSEGLDWRRKIKKNLQQNYAKAKYRDEVIDWLNELIDYPENNIARYNTHTILAICKRLNLTTSHFNFSSNLYSENDTSNAMLVILTKLLNGNAYMCGGGADHYQNENNFTENNVILIRQNFVHPKYTQFKNENFVPGLSIIDGLMHIGISGVKSILIKRNIEMPPNIV
jgi:hypothetical protein